MVADRGVVQIRALRDLMSQDVVLPTVKELRDRHAVIWNRQPLSNLTLHRAEALEHRCLRRGSHGFPDSLPALVVAERYRVDPSTVRRSLVNAAFAVHFATAHRL